MLKEKHIKNKTNSIKLYLHSQLRMRNGSSNPLSSPICVGLSTKKQKNEEENKNVRIEFLHFT